MTQQEFKVLFENHFADVRKYVFYRSGDTDVATDIAQETFLKIWEKQNSIQPEKVKGLLYKIAGDLYISHYRKEKRSFRFFNSFVFENESQSPEEEMTFNQLKENYSNSLEKMNEKQRTVFLLSRAENLKYTEIAEVLGISVKAVEKRMKNALNHLRNILKQ
ncbi:MAG TPA: RNA polymerase sigma factor [Draconibacterium sp.]|nr:RNA polymerase sigma factor [Draconibacterium sp.]HRX11993.1 RNA polymerase sigma factor [Draconibacterium sp.]